MSRDSWPVRLTALQPEFLQVVPRLTSWSGPETAHIQASILPGAELWFSSHPRGTSIWVLLQLTTLKLTAPQPCLSPLPSPTNHPVLTDVCRAGHRRLLIRGYVQSPKGLIQRPRYLHWQQLLWLISTGDGQKRTRCVIRLAVMVQSKGPAGQPLPDTLLSTSFSHLMELTATKCSKIQRELDLPSPNIAKSAPISHKG